MPTQKQLADAVEVACNRLEINEGNLFSRNINERTLSHKFAIYLQQEVDLWGEEWDVDCEFNRNIDYTGENYSKALNLIDAPSVMKATIHDENASTVFPDIIVHKRGSGDNLLVVENKKYSKALDSKTSREAIEYDRDRKLPAYVQQLGYRAAVFVLINLDIGKCQRTWVEQLA